MHSSWILFPPSNIWNNFRFRKTIAMTIVARHTNTWRVSFDRETRSLVCRVANETKRNGLRYGGVILLCNYVKFANYGKTLIVENYGRNRWFRLQCKTSWLFTQCTKGKRKQCTISYNLLIWTCTMSKVGYYVTHLVRFWPHDAGGFAFPLRFAPM